MGTRTGDVEGPSDDHRWQVNREDAVAGTAATVGAHELLPYGM
jgi:hypothetical protein